jgi:hypothetical protein
MPFDRIEVKPGLPPMEAKLVDALPDEPGLAVRARSGTASAASSSATAPDRASVEGGQAARPIFPGDGRDGRAPQAERFALDGELVIPNGDRLDFEALQMRLHPAESRIRKARGADAGAADAVRLSRREDGKGLLERPLTSAAGSWKASMRARGAALLLSPYATNANAPRKGWLDQVGTDLDGVIAKREDGPYVSGERVMLKIKCMRTADCVVGGFRYAAKGGQVGSLLLGLYNEEGKLDHVGFTSAIPAGDKAALTERLEALIEAPGFTGDAPGGPSRWATERSTEWQPLRPELIAEVRYDHVTGRRFRHGTKFLRWRPDKAPEQCRMDQLQAEARPDALAGALERPK